MAHVLLGKRRGSPRYKTRGQPRLLIVILIVAASLWSTDPAAAEVLLTDPHGDAGPLGAAVPVVYDWADIVSVELQMDGEANESLLLGIHVAGVDGGPSEGEVGITFHVSGRYFIAGYTMVDGYRGGFLCTSDARGDVGDSDECDSMPGRILADRFEATLALEALMLENGTGVLDEPWAWSERTASNGDFNRLDKTAIGKPFSIQPPSGKAPQNTSAPPFERPTQTLESPPQSAPSTATPSPGGALVVCAILALALATRRTRSGRVGIQEPSNTER